MSDSQGIILGESDAELFYDSINREYLAGEIDRDVYIDRVTEYTTNDKVSISYDGGEEYRHFYYESKNLRAKFVVKDEDDYLYSLYLKNTNDDKLTLANILLSSLINGNYITQNQYDSELAYLSSKGLTNEIDREIKRFIPFEEYYKEAYWDYVYYDNIAKSESSCFDNETNYCRMYLSDDMIEVGGEVDVSIYTEFSDTIQEGTRYLSYFLQYLKNF